MKYTVHEDQPLLEALAHLAPGTSKTTLRSWLKDGRITVDGVVAKIGSHPVYKAQEIRLEAKPSIIPGGIRIYYEDRHLVVIEKPSGLLSVATAFEKGETAHGILKEYYYPRKIFVVHRIDQDTSGVMLFSFTEQAYERLKSEFEQHHIERAYTAIVEGRLTTPKGTWKSYLEEDANYFVRSTNDEKNGRLAITHYEEDSSNNRRTRLILNLETGRKNQIRVHCQDAGHPIVGDKKYGATTNPIKRLCLHAHLLAFKHPVTKKAMRFESPLPESFDRLI